ncbi:MAG: protein kinase [Verrucomicrobiota bacterium]
MSHPSFNDPSLEDLGRLLPAFDIEGLVAKGGMGAVYKAKQRSLARDVAIKILPREFGSDPLFRQSFETEARAMARLNHPNLIGVYDSGAVDGMLYIVMEYVPGKSLYHSSYGRQVDPVQAAQLIQGICAGLGHAHENGIIHRDIKPANILLTAKVEPKIGDFGLARLVESDGSGLVMGTPGYTAPEVIHHPHFADRRSDLYAVGVILYELVTGHGQESGAPPPSSRCGCGPGIDVIWRRATHEDPACRYQDAHAFSTALAEWLVSKDSSVKRKAVMPAPAPQTKGVPLPPLTSAKSKAPAANVATQVQARPQGSGIATFLQYLFLVGVIGLSVYFWKVKVAHDKEMTIIAEKNAQTLEEYKRLQEGSAKTPRPQENGPARQPVAPAIPNKTPAPAKEKPSPSPYTPTRPQYPPTRPQGTASPNSDIDNLSMRAKELVVAADKKRAEQLAVNINSFNSLLDEWLRGQFKSEQAAWQPHVAKLKATVRNARVPSSIPRESGLSMSSQMSNIAEVSAKKQEQIDAAFLADVNRIRVAYLAKLRDGAAAAEQGGQPDLANSLRADARQAIDNEKWLLSFGINPKPVGQTWQRYGNPGGGGR